MFGHAGMVLALGSIFALGSAVPVAWAHGTTERVSVSSGGVQGNNRSSFPTISAGGRFVAFASDASNLVPGDTNNAQDIFVHDRQTGTTQRVSVSSGGAQGNSLSFELAISAGGRFVAFSSFASNLVAGDTNDINDVFLHDLWTGVTSRVSVGPGGRQADGGSQAPSFSANGRFLAFNSAATNLVPNDTNGWYDVFVYDRQTRTTERVNITSDGSQTGGAFSGLLSSNGRFVAFSSTASDLVSGDTNIAGDVFVHDRRTGVTSRVSVGPGGIQAENGNSYATGISADGRFVAFESQACNLVPNDTPCGNDVFVHDRRTGVTSRMSVRRGGGQADGQSGGGAMSANGRFVTFVSQATNLVRGDSNGFVDTFLRDRLKCTTQRVSVSSGGAQGNGNSSFDSSLALLSANGRFIAFVSSARNLVPGDTNLSWDIFVRTLAP